MGRGQLVGVQAPGQGADGRHTLLGDGPVTLGPGQVGLQAGPLGPIIYIAIGIIGWVVHGLLWLFAVAVVLFVVTLLAGTYLRGRRAR